jgi:enamine deaminase RidA (YjgF/YER057c/UK114 family)
MGSGPLSVRGSLVANAGLVLLATLVRWKLGESAWPRGWQASAMTLELINPPDLPIPHTYAQVVVATGSRLVFVAGQEPEDAKGHLVGPGDLAVQARQASNAERRVQPE